MKLCLFLTERAKCHSLQSNYSARENKNPLPMFLIKYRQVEYRYPYLQTIIDSLLFTLFVGISL